MWCRRMSALPFYPEDLEENWTAFSDSMHSSALVTHDLASRRHRRYKTTVHASQNDANARFFGVYRSTTEDLVNRVPLPQRNREHV